MRMIEIILTELASDKLKAEERLQRLINDTTIDVVDQTDEIKSALDEVVRVDNMIAKWRSYTATPQQPQQPQEPQNNNNNNN